MKALPKTPVPVADNATALIAFQLLAPNNATVMLMGSFNAWQELPMAKGADGYFRVTVPLVDGAHQYKFRLQSQSWFFTPGEWVEITDPYA
ncbi:MAG: hypothetical protein H7338_24820, partial [Candidatus Sericytochromatia bacterium]|nr:hypothetical protein [Candidatus Sericytochromatia bacterium]